MPSSTRANSQARSQIIEELKQDHQRVKKAYRDFGKLDPAQDAEACEEIVQQVLQELQVHATLEEELLYPAARAAIDEDLVDEAEVEHESAHTLIEQLLEMDSGSEKFAARFTVLCEYVMHHVKEEEKEMFPLLEKARGIDWQAMAQAMQARRAELQGTAEGGAEEEEAEEATEAGAEDETAPAQANAGTDDRDAARPERPEPQREPRKARREKPLGALTSSGAAGGRRM